MVTLIPAISIFLISLPTYYFYIKSVGWKRGLLTILILSLYALFIETIALKTGLPYGEFKYRESLGTDITGGLPWPVLFAWPPLVISSIALAKAMVPKKFIAIASVLILISYDLLFDPIAVKLHFWEYVDKGMYYGVPWSNFVGWAFSGFVGFYIYKLLRNPISLVKKSSLSLVIYTVIWTIASLVLQIYSGVLIGVIILYVSYSCSRQ